MTLLEENINEILRQKNNFLLPQNIKAGVEVLGVVGTLEATLLDTEYEQIREITSRILGEG